MLPSHEQVALRYWLMLLMEADEPDAMLACLKRIAERKASDMYDFDKLGMYSKRPISMTVAHARWLRLVEALDKVEREMKLGLEFKGLAPVGDVKTPVS